MVRSEVANPIFPSKFVERANAMAVSARVARIPPCTVPEPLVISCRYGSFKTARSGDTSSRLAPSHPSGVEAARRPRSRSRRSGASSRALRTVALIEREIVREAIAGSPDSGLLAGLLVFGVIGQLLRAASRVVELPGNLHDRAGDVDVANVVFALVGVDVLVRLLLEPHDRLVG